jgi:hypothetical protein
MHAIRIIGSTELGWHPAHIYTPEVLATFAGFRDVIYFRFLPTQLHLAPSVVYAFAKSVDCPFTLVDAHAVLALLRPHITEAKSAKHKTNNRVK